MKVPTLFLFIAFGYLRLQAQTSSQSSYPNIHLTDSVRCTEVKDQASSPTCWVFGTNSLFESDILKISGKRFNFSEMFIARYAYIDKARQFLASKGKTYFEGGGQFHDVIRIIDKYGMLPEDAYTGRPDGEGSHNHAKLDTAMKKLIHGLLKQGKKKLNDDELRQVNVILDRYLGKVPETFRYDLKTFTPKTFAKEVLPATSEYIEVMSFDNLPYYKKCLLDDKFNWAGDSLYNIPLTDFQMLVDTALAKGWSIGWEGDVTEQGFNFWNGYAVANEPLHQYHEERLLNFKNETTERDHMLHLVGIGRDDNNSKWYYLKNSWGDTWLTKLQGYMYMQEEYFKLKTVVMMVNKAALPKSLREKLFPK
ncbi:MAG TPA: C1 family peptidase [Chitinophagaceae bacterium]|nr:C1 family peptidase [Chitinophagaceae bacterium]